MKQTYIRLDQLTRHMEETGWTRTVHKSQKMVIYISSIYRSIEDEPLVFVLPTSEEYQDAPHLIGSAIEGLAVLYDTSVDVVCEILGGLNDLVWRMAVCLMDFPGDHPARKTALDLYGRWVQLADTEPKRELVLSAHFAERNHLSQETARVKESLKGAGQPASGSDPEQSH